MPAAGPTQAAHSHTQRDPAPAGGNRIGRVLGLARRLISYGKDLVDRVFQQAGTPAFARLAKPFGTTDMGAILGRIMRGIQLAMALEERLARRAARGQDIAPPAPIPPRNPAAPGPGAQRLRLEPAEKAALQALRDNPMLPPSPGAIAGLLRRRPVGEVIAEICRDFGILPGEGDPELWRELERAITEFGGNLATYATAVLDRTFGAERARAGLAKPQSPEPLPLALATGPP